MVGLIVAVIFSAAMSSTSGEINSLATVTVIDIYQRHINRNASDHHYLMASRLATVFWGCYAVGFAQYGRELRRADRGREHRRIAVLRRAAGRVRAGVLLQDAWARTGAFAGVLAGEAAIFAANLFTNISFLWYNVIGCLVVIAVAVLVSRIFDPQGRALATKNAVDTQG